MGIKKIGLAKQVFQFLDNTKDGKINVDDNLDKKILEALGVQPGDDKYTYTLNDLNKLSEADLTSIKNAYINKERENLQKKLDEFEPFWEQSSNKPTFGLDSEKEDRQNQNANLQKELDEFEPFWEQSSNKTITMQTAQIDNARTGGIVGVYVDDTTSYSIDFNKHEITKINGDIRTTYKMTPEQRRMSQQQLINSLQKKTENNEYNLEIKKDVHDSDPVIYNGSDVDSAKDKKIANENNNEPTQPAKAVTEQPVRTISGNGINGTYAIIETPNGGYELNQNFTVRAYENQAAQAFQNGLTSKYGTLNVKPDENGQYNFRGIKARTYSILSMQVQQRSQQIAGYTAIYQDLQDKQNSGENLSAGEQKFISFYNELLQKSGLQMNSNGELEDIPTSRHSRKLKN